LPKCCSGKRDPAVTSHYEELGYDEATPIARDEPIFSRIAVARPLCNFFASKEVTMTGSTYKVVFHRRRREKVGIDVEFLPDALFLPVTRINGGLAEQWNSTNPERSISKGDRIVKVNGFTGSIKMLEQFKHDGSLTMMLTKAPLTMG